MSSPLAVEIFWKRAGVVESFPRNLVNSAELALPLRIIGLAPLELWYIERWFQRRDSRFRFNCKSRAVRGCLIAFAGNGFIFIDESDAEDERRFTVAHEVGHFLVDYWLPRHRAIEKLGPGIVEVMDKKRPPTPGERVHALLSHIPIGLQTSLMERGNDEEMAETWRVENRADRVGVSLLAPSEVVLPRADLHGKTYHERLNSIVNLLQVDFGLPVNVAKGYGATLLSTLGKGPSWAETLRLK